MHGSHRVVTERLGLAAPQTGIRLFPHAGGGWFLPRFPGEAGTYLGLTGARANAADARWLGYATAHVPHERLDAVVDALGAADWRTGPAHDVGTPVLPPSAPEPGESALSPRAPPLNRCFAGGGVEDTLPALGVEGAPWAEETRA